jgi:hypothetical protein
MASAIRNMFSPAVGWKTYFSSEYFWKEANVGPFFWGVLAAPFIYGGIKEMYWTRQLKQMNRQEIINDRFNWLHKLSLDAEIEKVVLNK